MMYRPVIFILISVSSVLCQIDQFRSRPQACLEAPLPGTCRALLPRFYFNPLTGSCDCFIYGGCQGGRNNFLVLAQCMQTCGVHPSTQFSSDACNRIFPSFPSVTIPSVTIPVIATTESNFNNLVDLRNPVEQRGTQSPLTNENMDRLQEIFNQASQQHIQGLDNVATHKIEPQQPLNDGAAHRIPPPQVINDGAAHKIPPPQQGLNDGAAHRIPPPQGPEKSSDEQQGVTSRPVTTGRPLRPVTQFPVTRRPVSTTTLRPTTTFAQKVQEGQRQQLAQTIEEQKQRQAIQQQVQQDQLEDQRKTQQELLERHFGTGVRVRQATGGRIN